MSSIQHREFFSYVRLSLNSGMIIVDAIAQIQRHPRQLDSRVQYLVKTFEFDAIPTEPHFACGAAWIGLLHLSFLPACTTLSSFRHCDRDAGTLKVLGSVFQTSASICVELNGAVAQSWFRSVRGSGRDGAARLTLV